MQIVRKNYRRSIAKAPNLIHHLGRWGGSRLYPNSVDGVFTVIQSLTHNFCDSFSDHSSIGSFCRARLRVANSADQQSKRAHLTKNPGNFFHFASPNQLTVPRNADTDELPFVTITLIPCTQSRLVVTVGMVYVDVPTTILNVWTTSAQPLKDGAGSKQLPTGMSRNLPSESVVVGVAKDRKPEKAGVPFTVKCGAYLGGATPPPPPPPVEFWI
jgi:hypothetical protein